MSTWESEMTPEDANTHRNNLVQLQRMEDFGDELDDWFAANRDQAFSAIDYPGVLDALSVVFTALMHRNLSEKEVGPALLSIFKAGVFIGTRLSDGWIPGPEDDNGLDNQARSILTDEELNSLLNGSERTETKGDCPKCGRVMSVAEGGGFECRYYDCREGYHGDD